MSAVTSAVRDQHTKLLGVLGGLQCLKIACGATPDQGIELEAAAELLEDEVQRIVNALDSIAGTAVEEAETEVAS
ncbi:MAG: hypothetical protein ACYDAE_00265 [Steroidobacteraceae bacterium]